MTGVLLDPSSCLGAEKLDFVLIDRGGSYVLVVEGCGHVEYSLVKASHGLELVACRCIPRLHQAITTASVENLAISIECQTSGFRLMRTDSPVDMRWH